MIDDKPRSATVTALEATVLHEVDRDDFFQSIETDRELALKLLRVLFERLRKANRVIAQMRLSQDQQIPGKGITVGSLLCRVTAVVRLEGLTPQAAGSLPINPFQIKKFPFLIGRKTRDPFAYNDLAIADSPPYRISRHHIEIDHFEGRVVAADRGSQLGSLVDGQLLGGPGGNPGPLMFNPGGGTLVLGDKRSPYKYKVMIES